MVFAILLGLTIVLGYLLNKYLLTVWSRLGFKQLEPSFFVGNAGPLLQRKVTFGEFFADIYNEHKDSRIVGVYVFYRPILIVTDPKIVQDIMIRDFTNFHDRPLPCDEVKDPLSGHLFNLPGQKWRDLRVKLSPSFTSGKLKGMFPIIKDCAEVLDKYLDKSVKSGVHVFDFYDLMARFNINIISSVAFGIENDCINEPDHIFRQIGSKIFEANKMNAIRGLVALICPQHFHTLGLKFNNKEIDDFIFSMVKQTVEHREQKNFMRNDFLQLLMQLKNQGYVSVDKGEVESDEVKNGNVNKIDINQLAAQVFVFFAAGFETSSSTLSYSMFEFARHPEIQKKVQEEIDRALMKSGKDGITYNMFNDLKYLECCIDETLRKYPILPMHLRSASNDYKIADSNLIIPKGTSVYIPVLGFQRDPDIYDEPMEFRPERFIDSPNGGGKTNGVFYSPFGDGPRNCIGMRLAKLTTKIGLTAVLSKYNFELVDKEMNYKEIEFHPTQVILTPKKLIKIKITPRK